MGRRGLPWDVTNLREWQETCKSHILIRLHRNVCITYTSWRIKYWTSFQCREGTVWAWPDTPIKTLTECTKKKGPICWCDMLDGWSISLCPCEFSFLSKRPHGYVMRRKMVRRGPRWLNTRDMQKSTTMKIKVISIAWGSANNRIEYEQFPLLLSLPTQSCAYYATNSPSTRDCTVWPALLLFDTEI